MRGKSGPKPGPVKTPEQKAAEKAAKTAAAQEKATAAQAEKDARAKAKADAKAAKEKEEADKKAAREAEKAAKAAAKASPGIGHNSAPLTDEERRAILVGGVVAIIGFQEEIASVNSALRNERKRLIANGYEPFEINFAIKLRKSQNEDGDVEEWRKLQRVALFMNHPIGTQVDLFDSAPDRVDRTPLVDRAKAAGKMAGMAGERCEPPHDLGSEAGQAWVSSWHEGQALLVRDNISPIVKKAEPAQASFDDVLPKADAAEGDDGFEPAVPDHAKDPTSPANPNNVAAAA